MNKVNGAMRAKAALLDFFVLCCVSVFVWIQKERAYRQTGLSWQLLFKTPLRQSDAVERDHMLQTGAAARAHEAALRL